MSIWVVCTVAWMVFVEIGNVEIDLLGGVLLLVVLDALHCYVILWV